MSQTIDKKEEYILTKTQFEEAKSAGKLVVGATYHVTDDPTAEDLINGTEIAKYATYAEGDTTSILDRFASIETQVETNKTNIESLTEGVDLSALQNQMNENTSDISDLKSADETLKSSIDTVDDSAVHKTGNETISGVKTFEDSMTIKGDLTITGNISQEGETYETHAEQVYSTNDYIYLRDGATGALTNYSGLEVLNYDGNDTSMRLAVDGNGVARVGDAGDEQPLATREESPTANALAYWDSTNKKFVTDSGITRSASGTITATTFIGNLSGTASKATADGDGNTFSSYYVSLSTSQTISGAKTFSANPYITRGNPYLVLKDSSYAKGTAPSSTQWRGITFSDKSSYRFAQMEHSYGTDMSTNLYVRNYRATTAESYTNYGQTYLQLTTNASNYGSAGLYAYNASGTLYGAILESSTTSFRPNSTGTISLGTSSYKWKNLYLSGNLSDGTNSVAVSEIEKRVLIYSVSTPNTSTVINLTDLGISVGDTIEVELQLMNGTSEVNYTSTKYLVRTTISSQTGQYFRGVSVTYMTLNSSSTDSSGNAVGDGYIYNYPCDAGIYYSSSTIYLYPNNLTTCKRLSYSTSTGQITRYDSSDYKWAINKVYKIG